MTDRGARSHLSNHTRKVGSGDFSLGLGLTSEADWWGMGHVSEPHKQMGQGGGLLFLTEAELSHSH